MKKAITSLFASVVCSAMLFGCTMTIDAKENPSGTKNNQNTNEHIQMKVAKHYEDGFDLQIQLNDVQQAKGDWTVTYCGIKDVQNDQGKTIISGFGYSDCKEQSNDNVKVQFTGEADGKQVTWNTVHKLTQEEINQVPLEREDPTRWDDIRNFVQSGNLENAVQFGASKEDVIKYWGEPSTKSDDSTLDYGYMSFRFNPNNQLNDITFNSTNDSPIDVSIAEIEKAFGQPVETEGAAGTSYTTYDFNDYTVLVAWSNVTNSLRYIEVKSKNYQ